MTGQKLGVLLITDWYQHLKKPSLGINFGPQFHVYFVKIIHGIDKILEKC